MYSMRRSKYSKNSDYDTNWNNQNGEQSITEEPRAVVGGAVVPTGDLVAR